MHLDHHMSFVDDVKAHPLSIKPAGNAFTAASASTLRASTGALGRLTDKLILQVLDYLEDIDLQCLGSTCKVFYAFSTFEELWKNLFIERHVDLTSLKWRGTWRNTLLKHRAPSSSSVSCNGIYSDLLYRPFHCAHISLARYVTSIPPRNAIQRVSDLSHAEYVAEFAKKPFILTSPVGDWPLFHKWSLDALQEEYGNVVFRAEAVDWSLENYLNYLRNNDDESPLYLFDRYFVEKMKLRTDEDTDDGTKDGTDGTMQDYWPPKCFGDDLFAVLGDQRPAFRWLIVGGERSGSTFHKDPNATSAWNAVLQGSKYWIMFPPSETAPPPPGVYVSEDHSEVTSPLSIAEWLLGFHAAARMSPGCKEGICGEGEMLHVPSGWWHLVINLEPTIAITQNFVPAVHLSAVLHFLRDKPQQVSGFNAKQVMNPHQLFVNELEAKHPDVLKQALRTLDSLQGRKRKWDEVVHNNIITNGRDGGGFSFNFSGGDDENGIDDEA
ncbi:MAG: hypothetical protein M1833_002480 [Piccolia ochrophora]|nr:MAG: hypothetical protein M1833_002480 [Piccolia ochrophora]